MRCKPDFEKESLFEKHVEILFDEMKDLYSESRRAVLTAALNWDSVPGTTDRAELGEVRERAYEDLFEIDQLIVNVLLNDGSGTDDKVWEINCEIRKLKSFRRALKRIYNEEKGREFKKKKKYKIKKHG